MVWSLAFGLLGGALAYMAVYSEQQNKIHLSRNNWSSFWNGAVCLAGVNLAVLNFVKLIALITLGA